MDQDFVYYPDSDEEDEINDNITKKVSSKPSSFPDFLSARETGLTNVCNGRFMTRRLNSEYTSHHMLVNDMYKETEKSIPQMNKIYCSQWLSHDKVIFGSKCNKLMVFDVNKHLYSRIPLIRSPSYTFASDRECGIYSIKINPSRNLVATSGKNANQVAFYNLPYLNPICLGEGAHTDWIFDMCWLDDQFLVSGSRDGTLALWRITDDIVEQVTSSNVPSFAYSKPLAKKKCKTAEKVRAMCFNSRRSELAVISPNGYIHCWDGLRFKQLMSKRLPYDKENVCLTADDESTIYAVGSKFETYLLDTRTLQRTTTIKSRHNDYGIRSLSLRGNLLTIGTGIGFLYFWDIRAGKYLDSSVYYRRAVSLKASKGWIQRDDNFVQNFEMIQQKYLPAIYTHCYDTSGTRLFVGGGPLQCGLRGNYVGIFQ